MDDEATWALILTDEWGDLSLDAVVRRVEQAMRCDRARLVRTVLDPDHAPPTWVEHVHDVVLAAIHVETGADLEELGSQAAWAVYEKIWDELRQRWSDGGRLVAVDRDRAQAVESILSRLPVEVAMAAGADTSTIPSSPLVVDGVVLLDAEGIFAWIATGGDGGYPAVVRDDVDTLLGLVRPPGT